ncbi:RNA ligase, DRB0094 family [Hypoxylon crocopeplum]|nr:RNA ligase, DRB0094 family [Hypoxylon crocopeplum]
MARKLVSIRVVGELRALPESLKYEVANIDGWSVIVHKGSFTAGEAILFFEIDCFLPPEDPRFALSQNPLHNQVVTWQGSKGIHIKSVMFNKVVSQGLVLKLHQFPEVTGAYSNHGMHDENIDLAEKLGIKKWELSPKELTTTLGKPPTFIPSTNLERVQNCRNLFTDKYKDEVFQESTKMDGSSMTVYFVTKQSCWYRSLRGLPPGSKADMASGRFGVCSRNSDLPETGKTTFWEVALRHGLPQKLAGVNRNLAIQGELCGSTIQKNRHSFPKGGHDFFVFSIFDIDSQQRFPPAETIMRAKQLDLPHVPVHGNVRLHDIARCTADLLKRAEGVGDDGNKREGLVFKNINSDRGFKVIANNYLLQHGE